MNGLGLFAFGVFYTGLLLIYFNAMMPILLPDHILLYFAQVVLILVGSSFSTAVEMHAGRLIKAPLTAKND